MWFFLSVAIRLTAIASLLLVLSDRLDWEETAKNAFKTKPKGEVTLQLVVPGDSNDESQVSKRTTMEVQVAPSAPERLKSEAGEFVLTGFPEDQGVGTVNLTLPEGDAPEFSGGLPVAGDHDPVTLWLTVTSDDADDMVPGTYIGHIVAVQDCEEDETCEQTSACDRPELGEEEGCEDRYGVKDVRIEIERAPTPTPKKE